MKKKKAGSSSAANDRMLLYVDYCCITVRERNVGTIDESTLLKYCNKSLSVLLMQNAECSIG